MILVVILGSTLQAAESNELSVPEKARTASFVFKAELFLGCKKPFEMSSGSISKESEAFMKIWLNEDVAGLGESDIAKTQKKKMATLVEDLHFVFARDLVNPKWEDKDVGQIAELLTANLRSIASEAGVVLECDKEKEQNNAIHQP